MATKENKTKKTKIKLEDRTPTEQKKYYGKVKWATFIGEFVSVLTPFVVIAITNYEKYFVEYDGVKMSISFFMALAVMGMATYLIASKKYTNTFITLILGWIVVAFIFTLMGELISDIATIMWFGAIGILGAYGLDIVSNKASAKIQKIDEAIETANKEDMVEAVKKEKENKKKSEKSQPTE